MTESSNREQSIGRRSRREAREEHEEEGEQEESRGRARELYGERERGREEICCCLWWQAARCAKMLN